MYEQCAPQSFLLVIAYTTALEDISAGYEYAPQVVKSQGAAVW
jgi:hypothetical protein